MSIVYDLRSILCFGGLADAICVITHELFVRDRISKVAGGCFHRSSLLRVLFVLEVDNPTNTGEHIHLAVWVSFRQSTVTFIDPYDKRSTLVR